MLTLLKHGQMTEREAHTQADVRIQRLRKARALTDAVWTRKDEISLQGRPERGLEAIANAAFSASGFVAVMSNAELLLTKKALKVFRQFETLRRRLGISLAKEEKEDILRIAMSLLAGDLWTDRLKKSAAHAERMKKLHADPAFAAAHAERSREKMKKLNADPEFAAAHAKRSREKMKKLHADPAFAAAHAERMKKLNADPAFAAAHAERMKKLHADPDFAAAHKERGSKRMKKLHADPEFIKRRKEGIKAYWERKRGEKQDSGSAPPPQPQPSGP